MDCCGYDRVTPFCPMCGKVMNEKPIYVLLRHIKKYRDSIQDELDTNTKIHGEHGEKSKFQDSGIFRKGLTRRLRKWDGWYKALVELLETKGIKPDENHQTQDQQHTEPNGH